MTPGTVLSLLGERLAFVFACEVDFSDLRNQESLLVSTTICCDFAGFDITEYPSASKISLLSQMGLLSGMASGDVRREGFLGTASDTVEYCTSSCPAKLSELGIFLTFSGCIEESNIMH